VNLTYAYDSNETGVSEVKLQISDPAALVEKFEDGRDSTS
jgi:hypothetical protein